MSTYPGNTTLSAAVKERVLSTFQQTLALYKQGRVDEVAQGCGLILRMDPMFDPAKKLLEKTRNPAAPINVDALLTTEPSADPMIEARNAYARRDFQRTLEITTELLTQDLMNDDARILNEKARERMEAQPFIEQFTKKVEASIASGNAAAAKTDIEKILRRVAENTPGRSMIVLISDLFVDREALFRAIEMLRHGRHDILLFHVMDEDELVFPFTGTTRFEGMEELEQVLCDPRALRDNYLEVVQEYLTEVRRGCARWTEPRFAYRHDRRTHSRL